MNSSVFDGIRNDIMRHKDTVIDWLKEAALDAAHHEPDVGIRGSESLAEAFGALATFVKNIDQHIIVPIQPNLPPEGERTKYQELEAAYAALFSQLNPVVEENTRLRNLLRYRAEPYGNGYVVYDARTMEPVEKWDTWESAQQHAYELNQDAIQLPVDEDLICKKLCEWMEEGEGFYDNPKTVQPGQAHPNTLKGYMQTVGWVRRDLRVCLDRAKEEIKQLKGHGNGK